MFVIVLISLIALLFLLVYYASLNKAILEVMPTIAWFTFMVIPFFYSMEFFDNTGTNLQFLGITFICLALLVGDWYSVKTKSKILSNTEVKTEIGFSSNIQLVLILAVVAIPIIHTLISGTSPLLNYVFKDSSTATVSMDRVSYTKFGTPYFFAILSNWVTNIIMPLIIAWLFFQKKYFWSFIIFVWSILYALNSTAISPVIFLLFSLGLILLTLKFRSFRNIFEISLIVGFACVILSGLFFKATSLNNLDKCPPPTGVVKSPTNILRSCPDKTLPGLNPIINEIGYRVFFTPVEVSNNWYKHFSMEKNKMRSFSELFEQDIFLKTSNLIGNEYYLKNFPNYFSKWINAPASIDADAFSFGGLPLVLLLSILLIFIRVFISTGGNNSPPEVQAFENLALAYLILLPCSASIQAILIPQGLLPVLLVLFYLRKVNYNIINKLYIQINKFILGFLKIRIKISTIINKL